MTWAYHVGIDLHKSVAQICVRGPRGGVMKEQRRALPDLAAGRQLISELAALGRQARFAVEAVGCNRWFVLGLREAGREVLVVDAGQLGLKRKGRKTDKRDAREIARRLWLGDLERHARTYFPTNEEYGRRKLVRVRHMLVRRRTETANHIKGLLSAHLLHPPRRDLHTRPQLNWLRQVELPTEDERFALDMLVDELESLQTRIRALEKRVRSLEAEDEDLALLTRELPSVGALTALTIRAELGDARRFARTRAVGAYAGVVPRVNNSADAAHHGAVTKRGNEELRWILSQWAVRLLAFHPQVRRWAKPRLRRAHKNKVRTALARRLLIGVWAMLARGEVFSLERCLGQAA